MGIKGDKGAKEPIAINLYAQGKSLTEISGVLKISITTLSTWKTDSKKPDSDIDEWDRARQQKRGMIQRLKDMYEGQMNYLESLHPSERNSQMMDALSKLGSLVEQRDKAEQFIFEKLESITKEASEKKEMTKEEMIKRIREDVYGLSEEIGN